MGATRVEMSPIGRQMVLDRRFIMMIAMPTGATRLPFVYERRLGLGSESNQMLLTFWHTRGFVELGSLRSLSKFLEP